MKKRYQSPEMHAVDVSVQKSISELARMSDEDLLKELKASGYFENKICYQAAKQFVSRDIAGEIVLVPIGEQAQRLNGFATFSETGQFLWNILVKGKCTKADLVFALSREYQRSEEELQEDVDYYLDKMMKNGFVVQCG